MDVRGRLAFLVALLVFIAVVFMYVGVTLTMLFQEVGKAPEGQDLVGEAVRATKVLGLVVGFAVVMLVASLILVGVVIILRSGV
jgi:flagellar biosynthesis protein FlhB